MQFKKFNYWRFEAVVSAFTLQAAMVLGQGFWLVDQASGTIDEIVTTSTQLPDNRIAQCFSPLAF